MCYEFEGLFRRRNVTDKLRQKIDALRTMRKPQQGAAPQATPTTPQPTVAHKAKDPVTT